MSQVATRAADPTSRIEDSHPLYEAKRFGLPLRRIEPTEVHLID
jgi:hypothetical protein